MTETTERQPEELRRVVSSVAAELGGGCSVPPGTPVVAACSGGADSVVLVAALAALATRWPLHAVAFVDHGLRDVSLEREAARLAATRAGAPFVETRLDLPEAGNRQSVARAARYRWLDAIRPAGGVIATGHTLTDQAETLLQRLLRGAGLRGLVAISSRSGQVVRPLLQVTRAQTRACAARSSGTLRFQDDPTNATGAYQRNRIRHDVLPALMAENTAAELHLATSARHAAEELALIDAILDRLDVSGADLTGLDARAAAALLRWRQRREHPTSAPWSKAALDAFAQRVVTGRDTSASLGSGIRGRARGGRVSLAVEADPRTVLVAPCPGSYGLPNLGLEILSGSGEDASSRTEKPRPGDRLHELTLDAQSLVWPLKVAATSDPDGAVLVDGAGRQLWPATPRPAGPDATTAIKVFIRVSRGAAQAGGGG